MRRVRSLTIPQPEAGKENRDAGKTFVLTELPADQAERWAFRLLLAIAHAGGKLPEGALEAGMAGVAATVQNSIVAAMRALSGLQYADVAPLLDIMFGCVTYQHAPGQPLQAISDGNNSQIEEVSTRLMLRWEVLQLHLNFSLGASPLTSATANPST